MADAAAPKAKKAAKPKVPAAHPPYAAMIAAAIKGLGDKKGSSRQAILKYVVANNKVDADKAAVRVKLALRKLIASKKVVAAAAAGKKGAGSYKLAVAKKKVKRPKAKKPAKKAKKPTKKADKMPAAKKAANNSVMIREHDFNKQCSMVAKPNSQLMNVIKLSFPFNPRDECCRALASPHWGHYKT